MSGFAILTRALVSYYRHDGPLLAAAIAFYAMFSLFPTLMIAVALIGFLLPPHAIERFLAGTLLAYFPGAEGLVAVNLNRLIALRGEMGLVGLVALLWSASGVFATLSRALNKVWDAPGRTFFLRRLIGIAMVIGVGAFLAASLVAGALLRLLVSGLPNAGAEVADTVATARWALLLPGVAVFILYLLLYRWAPAVDQGFADLWPGAVVAALGFEAIRFGFAWYVSELDTFQLVYGGLATVLLLLLWIYLVGTITLFGAEVAAAYRRARNRGN